MNLKVTSDSSCVSLGSSLVIIELFAEVNEVLRNFFPISCMLLNLPKQLPVDHLP
jgi:hypothetical protein